MWQGRCTSVHSVRYRPSGSKTWIRSFPVADVHPVIGADRDAVRQVELAGADPDVAPGGEQLTFGGEHVDPAVAVAVRHVDAPGRVDRQVGAAVEWLPRPRDGLDVVDDERPAGGAAGVGRLAR